MTINAGLIGYFGTGLPNERMAQALRCAPWRGEVTTSIEGALGGIFTLGSAQAGRYGQIAVVLHGRIDNLDTLAIELDVEPVLGKEHPDPCLVLAMAYLRWGEEFAGRVVGDFAAIVFDERRGVILGTRDWIGARPLFWGRWGETIAFASEVKQVLALLDRPYRIDEKVLAEYECLGDPALDATFAEGVSAVLPNGQVVAGHGHEPRAWRRGVRFEPINLPLPAAVRAVCDRLESAVGRRTAGAHRLGTLISGGMDSTSVTAIAALRAAHGAGPPVEAGFTWDFPEVPACDETMYAQAVADRWAIPWKPVINRPVDVLTWPERAFAFHDGPTFPTFFGVRNFLVAAREADIDVLLTGEGGDQWLSQREQELSHSLLRRDWRGVTHWGWYDVRRHPRATVRKVLRTWLRRLLEGERAEQYFENSAEDYWLRVALEGQEREGMRHGVRVEFPLCDIELARLLAGLRPSQHSLPGTTKLVLREAMRDLLPDSVIARPGKTLFDPILVEALETVEEDVPITIQIAHRYGAAWRELVAGERRPSL